MNWKKCVSCLMTALLLVVCLIGPAAFSAAASEDDNGLTFISNDDGTCYVCADKNVTKGDVVIPAKSPAGEPVESIGDFYGCEGVTSVKISEGVTGISTFAFQGCTALTSIELPASLAYVGSYSFQRCPALRSVTVASGAESAPVDNSGIGEATFYGCTALEEVELPDCMTEIWMQAFEGCTNLKSIHLPAGLQEIYYAAFSGCTALTHIEIPARTTSIDRGAFIGCTGMQNLTVAADNPVYRAESNCLIEKDTNFVTLGCGSFVIPADATGVRSYAFAGQSALTNVVIPERVGGLGDSAFEDCTNLKTVTIDSDDVIQQVWFGVNTAGLFHYESAVYVRADIDREAPDWFTEDYPYQGEVTQNGTVYRLYGTAPATHTDEKTGVQVSAGAGVLPPETELTVEPVESSDIVLESAEKYTAFDISLKQGDVKVQPNGKVQVSLPVPAGYDKAKLTVYRVEADGSKTELPCTVAGDTVTFETDHFSVYLLAEKTDAPSATPSTGGSEEQTDSPQTGDSNNPALWLLLMGCSGLALISAASYRKKLVK